jgi:hypothetical protein
MHEDTHLPEAKAVLRTKRADRRAHRRRVVVKALKTFATRISPETLKAFATKHADNLQSCSCSMCGNSRKQWGPTIQERRHGEEEVQDE